MRLIQNGQAPLDPENHNKMLHEHIPYRMSLLRDGMRPPWIIPCQHTNQAFEAGAVSGRILLSFIGLGCDRETSELKPTTKHDATKGMTDDVKAPPTLAGKAERYRAYKLNVFPNCQQMSE